MEAKVLHSLDHCSTLHLVHVSAKMFRVCHSERNEESGVLMVRIRRFAALSVTNKQLRQPYCNSPDR